MGRKVWFPVVSGPLAPYSAGFVSWLVSRAYSPSAAAQRLYQFDQLSRWLEREGLSVEELTVEQAERFAADRRAAGLVTWVSPRSVVLPLGYLRDLGVVPTPAAAVARGPLEELLAEYCSYLRVERRLSEHTVRDAYGPAARLFLAGREGPDGLGLERLSAADVSSFLSRECSTRSVSGARDLVCALRSFLRYLHLAGVIERPLVWAVPSVADLRDRTLPRGLEPAAVKRLLASCDRRRTVGRRDHAILLLLSRLGLRAGEVAAITLDDLDWRAGLLLVRGKGSRHDVLPLPVVIRSSLGHVVNVVLVLVLVSEATRILSASSTSSLPLLCVIVPGGPRMPGRGAQRRQRPASSECAGYGCRSLAGCRGAWWGRIGRSLSRSSVTWRG